jgi:hypothetical protein
LPTNFRNALDLALGDSGQWQYNIDARHHAVNNSLPLIRGLQLSRAAVVDPRVFQHYPKASMHRSGRWPLLIPK